MGGNDDQGGAGGGDGPVAGCVCHDLTFAELKRTAAEGGLDFEGLRARTGAGTGCGLCRPYIRLMLATGRTRFPVLSAAEAAGLLARHAAGRTAGDAGAGEPPTPPTPPGTA